MSNLGAIKRRSLWRELSQRLEPSLGPLEGAYRKETLRADARQISILLYIYLAVTAVYGVIDLRLFGLSGTFIALSIVRGLIFLALVASLFLLRRIQSYELMDRLVLAYGLVVGGLTLFVNSTRPETYFYNTPLDTLVVVTFYLAIPNRLLFRAIPAVIFSVGDLVIFWFFRAGVSPIGLMALVIALVSANIGCLLLSAQLNSYRRNQFKAQYIERLTREEAERLATFDALTGVLNRQRFMDAAESEFQRYQRYHRPFCLLFLDLDYLKQINDTYGHLAGDVALQQFGGLLRSQIRKTDKVGRLGGDEFAILLPETGTGDAFEIAGRICSSCTGMQIPVENSQAQLTTSIGVTEVFDADASVGDTLNRSDRALYYVKHHGRNGAYLIGAGADA